MRPIATTDPDEQGLSSLLRGILPACPCGNVVPIASRKMRVYQARRRALKALQPNIFCKMLRELMTETLFALGADQTLTDGMGTNVAEIVPSGLNQDRPKSDPCSKEALEITPPTSEIAAPRRGRGRPAGPSLRVLLTQKFPDGATAEMLIGAGFPGDFSTALKRGAIKQLEQDGRYVWIAKVAVSNCHRRRRPWSKLLRSVCNDNYHGRSATIKVAGFQSRPKPRGGSSALSSSRSMSSIACKASAVAEALSAWGIASSQAAYSA